MIYLFIYLLLACCRWSCTCCLSLK